MKLQFIVMLVSCCLLSACATIKDSWEGTKDVAYDVQESVSPDPEVDMEAYQFDNPNEEKLARLMTPVDSPLRSLIRYVKDKDTYPDENWMAMLQQRYPWIHSLILVDKDGWMMDRIPEDPIKRFSQPLEYSAVWRETFIQTVVDYPELGPELYVGTPMFKNADFDGLIIVSFDPRTLFNFCPEPEKLIIIDPYGGGVWTLAGGVDKQALLAEPWEDILEDEIMGQVEIGEKYYTWIVRYVGDDPYLYATESVDPDEDSFF